MGIYCFNRDLLIEALVSDAADPNSSHDFGKNVIPRLIESKQVYSYDFRDENKKEAKYWRDIGTIEAYYEANMDLNHVKPELNLYNREWPVRSTSYPDPPAKFVFDEEKRRGEALDSIVSGGCILSGGLVRKSVLGRGVRVHTGALVEGCVIMDNCDIGRHAKVRRAILDKNVRVPEGATVGYDLDADRARGWHVTNSGIVVIGREHSLVPLAAMFA
jgi:glucose-1-phosphate adenylyltransferase